MDQEIIEELQHLCLTKEEEEDILISTQSRDDLLEECSLSLFGRLLSDRQQNMRALKNTLRATWKMGSELRIVDVGNNTLQFNLAPVISVIGLKTVGHGILRTICFFFVGGRKASLLQILFSLTPPFRFSYGAYHLSSCQRKLDRILEGVWGI